MYFQENPIDHLKAYIDAQNHDPSTSFLILIAEKTAPNLNKFIEELNALNISFMGGIFPSLISGKKHHDTGFIIQHLTHIQKPIVVTDLSKPREKLNQISIPKTNQKLTQFVLVDGIADNISNFLFEMYNSCGNSVNYLGCGAGSLSLKSQNCLFSNEGVFKNAAIICLLNKQSKLGVRHGWEKIEGPFVATKTEGNTIHELNWKPAFEFYKELIYTYSETEIEKKSFLDVAKSYPFGIYKEDSEFIVRDPIAVENKSIICIAEVPENTILYLLTSNKEKLLAAASSTFKPCERSISNAQTGLIFDCISRALFLGEDFEDELSAVYQSFQKCSPGIKPEGALTLGEIALNGSGNLEFFNKTLVTGIIY